MSGSAGSWNDVNKRWVLEKFLRPGTLDQKMRLLPIHDIMRPSCRHAAEMYPH